MTTALARSSEIVLAADDARVDSVISSFQGGWGELVGAMMRESTMRVRAPVVIVGNTALRGVMKRHPGSSRSGGRGCAVNVVPA
ncbi:hypothetical protein ACEYYH_03335 [Microbacterium trichothecenolyticum]|uniref:hypothetical protein n=1 Tax=Microbacterium trichothecenolyticum TaxID=69370 RepID=UPI0035BE22D8